MKRYPAVRHGLLALAIALILFGVFLIPFALAAAPPGQAAPPSLSPEQAVNRAWQQAQAAGAYRFTADAEQTLIPRAISSMIGQTDQRVDTRLEGEVTLPDQARLTLHFEGAGPDTAPLEIIQDGTESFLVQDGEKIPVDNPAGLTAPSADYLGYLAAAENVREISDSEGAQSRIEDRKSPIGYAYDIDGQRFAEHVRDQIQASLHGQLPAGVQFSPSQLLASMSGHGELWVDADGLPRRQVVDLEMPGVSPEYDARVHLVVDFDFSAAKTPPEDASQPGASSSSFTPPGRLSDLHAPVSRLPLPDIFTFLVSLALAAALVGYRRRRTVYAVAVIAVSVTMVLTPLLQAGSITRFSTRVAHASGLSSALSDQLSVYSDAQSEIRNPKSPTSTLQYPIPNTQHATHNPQSAIRNPPPPPPTSTAAKAAPPKTRTTTA